MSTRIGFVLPLWLPRAAVLVVLDGDTGGRVLDIGKKGACLLGAGAQHAGYRADLISVRTAESSGWSRLLEDAQAKLSAVATDSFGGLGPGHAR